MKIIPPAEYEARATSPIHFIPVTTGTQVTHGPGAPYSQSGSLKPKSSFILALFLKIFRYSPQKKAIIQLFHTFAGL